MDWLSILSPLELLKAIISWFKRPKIEVTFRHALEGQENDFCHLLPNQFSSKSWFFRLKINNTGRILAEMADVRVEKIEEEVSGEFEELSISPFFLHWANEQGDNSRSLHQDTPVFVDVVYTVEDVHEFFVFHKPKHVGAGIPSRLSPGKYKFTVKILSPDIQPVQKTLLIEFEGNWEALSLELRNG